MEASLQCVSVHFSYFFPFLAVSSVARPEHFWELPSQRWSLCLTLPPEVLKAEGCWALLLVCLILQVWGSRRWLKEQLTLCWIPDHVPKPHMMQISQEKTFAWRKLLLQQNEMRIMKVNPVPRVVLSIIILSVSETRNWDLRFAALTQCFFCLFLCSLCLYQFQEFYLVALIFFFSLSFQNWSVNAMWEKW